jgi:hypothetical protein
MLPHRHTHERGGLLITCGDCGEVRLLRHPCVVAAAPANEGKAHCDRVACVRFLNEGRAAVSVGKHDKVIVRWEVVEEGAERGSVIVSGVPHSTRGAR